MTGSDITDKEYEKAKERAEKFSALATDILMLSRNTLAVNLRFLDSAINMLPLKPSVITETVATNGRYIFYDESYVLKSYKSGYNLTRAYLHMILHCVFRHNIVGTLVDTQRWNLACDIAVENIINELDVRTLASTRSIRQSSVIDRIKTSCGFVTAEKIYDYLLGNVDDLQIYSWSELFIEDDHRTWYVTLKEQSGDSNKDNKRGSDRSGKSNTDNGKDRDTTDNKSRDNSGGDENEKKENGNDDKSGDNSPDMITVGAASQLEKDWKEISEKMQIEIEAFSKGKGDEKGSLTQNLKAVNREKYDYTQFLKKFSVMGEAMRVNEDEFDYIFYTYGLKLYERMPLIEPLEYKEVKRIKEFVIAIDTSGSVSGELVQKFIQKTYNVLKNEESFFTKINLHIIQCDTDIQEDRKITSQEEFDEYLGTMKLHGFGGTDFRPVFAYVDKLIQSKEFTNLRGLIYFTDGYGDFPARKPPYETAFVFVDDEYNNPDVPPWAIKLVLQPEEI